MSTADCLCRELAWSWGQNLVGRGSRTVGKIKRRDWHGRTERVLGQQMRRAVLCWATALITGRHSFDYQRPIGRNLDARAERCERLGERVRPRHHEYLETLHPCTSFSAVREPRPTKFARLIVSPSPLRLPGRCFLLRSRLWRRRSLNNGGIQEFAGAIYYRGKIEFSIRIPDNYCARADNL